MNWLKKISPSLVLSLGLAFVFVYFGIDKLVTPQRWAGWIPDWASRLGDIITLVKYLGAVEVIFGLGLLVPTVKIRRWFTLLVVLHLLVVVSQVRGLTGVRDLGLFLAAVSLALTVWKKDDQLV